MSDQRLSQLQREILTMVRDAPQVQPGGYEDAKRLRRLPAAARPSMRVGLVRVNGRVFCLRTMCAVEEIPSDGVPVAYVRWQLARAHQQVRRRTTRYDGTRDSISSTFAVVFSKSLRNLMKKDWLDVRGDYGGPVRPWPHNDWAEWLVLTTAGREMLKVKRKPTTHLTLTKGSGVTI